VKVTDDEYRKKGSHIILGNQLWKDKGRREEAREHLRRAAEIEDRVLGDMIDEERGDWVVNAVSLLSLWKKVGDVGKEQGALEACLRLLETMPIDEDFTDYADKIRKWEVGS
jgi:hypothetical protein